MHETLRRRIVRRLETLPEAQLYQALDYIEFLESRHGDTAPETSSGLQKLAERLEDGLRSRTLSPSRLREAFQLIAAADRALSSVSEAGRDILSDLQVLGEGDQELESPGVAPRSTKSSTGSSGSPPLDSPNAAPGGSVGTPEGGEG